jgi:nitrogen fixation/metabolism regulation signal transduction histidine kinase
MSQPQAAAAPATKPYRRSVKNYLLNSRYQLKFTLTIVGISLMLTAGLGYVVMSTARVAARVVEVRAMDPTDTLAQELATQFASNDRIMMITLIAFGLLLALVLSAYGIILTHKVAGPLYKVTTYLDRIRDGKLGVVYNLRKGDELVEFFDHFKKAHDSLRAQTEDDIRLLDRAIATCSDEKVIEELRAAKAKKEGSLT